MNNKRATKRALLTSIMALVMCVVMLVGTTFAWFTDTASTGVNKIQAGNLDVKLEYKNTPASDFAEANENTPVFKDGALWEPGHVEYVVLKVSNAGNLALKYKLGINIASEVGSTNVLDNPFKLSDYIKFAVINGESNNLSDRDKLVAEAEKSESVAALNAGYTKGDHLLKGEYKVVTLVVWMPTDVGNDANYKVAEGITAPSIDLGINVAATQATAEFDSFDDQYDKDATYPVASAAEMKEALANGGIVSVNKDIKTDNIGDNEADRIIISQPTTLNLDAKIISPDDMGNNNTNFCALIVDADTTINAGENGGIDTGRNGGYALNVRNGANLTITGGSYYGGGTAVQVQEGTLTITGGHFAVEAFGEPYGYNFLLNCIDSAYRNGSAKIIVKGGTFVNFDPSNNAAEGAGTNFVADGYKVVSEAKENGDVWYTVVPR